MKQGDLTRKGIMVLDEKEASSIKANPGFYKIIVLANSHAPQAVKRRDKK